MNKRKNIIC